MAKTVLSLLLLLAVAAFALPVAMGFRPSVGAGGRSSTGLYMTKKYPSGRPCTVQHDEDMAMWFEDERGHAKKALKKHVAGRPVDKYTKEEVEAIEKKGVSPLSQFKIYMEWFTKRPQRGY